MKIASEILLDGNDWSLTGWHRNQSLFNASMELGIAFHPVVGPIVAEVPGAVQSSLIKAGIMKEPWYGLDSLESEWVENREWIFEKRFFLHQDYDYDRYVITFSGLDHAGEIILNNTHICDFEGMFIPVQKDITDKLLLEGENVLRVKFRQPPEIDGQFGFSSRIRDLKSRFNYVWDWCPRIINTGIWQSVSIKGYNSVRIIDIVPFCEALTETEGKVKVQVKTDTLNRGSYNLLLRVSKAGMIIMEHKTQLDLKSCIQVSEIEEKIKGIELWWPNGIGAQPVYELTVILRDENGDAVDAVNKIVGFKKVDFVNNPGAPKGAMPYTLKINGVTVFVKGVNWVPLSPYYGTVTREDYRKALTAFKDMNLNLLRVWGGGILETHVFYELCDEMGLMVWQEFPQSSSGLDNFPPDDPDFLEVLKETSTFFISQRRHHVSHVIWCGGNELMDSGFIPVNEKHPNIAMLKKLVEDLDPNKPFFPCSASGPSFCADAALFGKGMHHDVHGPWNYMGDSLYYSFFNNDDSLFRSETGCPGTSRMELLEKYQGNFSIWPPDHTNPYWIHRGAWWIQLEQMTSLFGSWGNDDMSMYTRASRYLQAEALRYVSEASMRRQPEISGLIFWMGNEPFPNNANTSILEFDKLPKPAYYWIRNAFSSFHASASYTKIKFEEDELFSADIFVTDEKLTGNVTNKCTLSANILDIYGKELYSTTFDINQEFSSGGAMKKLGSVEWRVKKTSADVFFLKLEVDGIERNVYCFTSGNGASFEAMRRLPEASVKIEKAETTPNTEKANTDDRKSAYIIENISGVVAQGIYVYGLCNDTSISIMPNNLTLFPGEKAYIEACETDGKAEILLVEAINMSTNKIVVKQA